MESAAAGGDAAGGQGWRERVVRAGLQRQPRARDPPASTNGRHAGVQGLRPDKGDLNSRVDAQRHQTARHTFQEALLATQRGVQGVRLETERRGCPETRRHGG